MSITQLSNSCPGITKRGHPCKNGINCRYHAQKDGEGIRDFVSNTAKKLREWIGPSIGKRLSVMSQGPRTGPTQRFKEFLEGEGNQAVVGLEVARKPIESNVRKALDWLSSGRFSKEALKLGYDDVLHSMLIVTLADGSQHIVHKNEVVERRPVTAADLKAERYAIKLPEGKNHTLKDLVLTAASTDKGEPASTDSVRRFWQYDARLDNCQQFVKQIVQDSGLIPVDNDPRALEILQPQSAGALVDTLKGFAGIPKLVTDMAATLDRGRYGDGNPLLKSLFRE